MELLLFEDDRAALTEKKNVNAFHGDELMEEHNYALQKADKPRLRSSTQKHMFCYLDFRCNFEANDQNHIHFRLIQVLKNGMIWHYILSLSDHFPASWNPVYIPVTLRRSRRANPHLLLSSLTSGRVKGS